MTELINHDAHAPSDGGRLEPNTDDAKLSDPELVIAVASGDHAAFAEIYTRYGARVHAAARPVCGHNQADDVVHEVFLRLWHKPESYDPERGSLRTFLIMQGRRRAIDLVRSDAARRSREVAAATRSPPTTDAAEAAGLATNQTRQLLSALPQSQHDAIVLAYYGHHTYREVAELLHQPEGTIKSRIRNGLRTLSAQLLQS